MCPCLNPPPLPSRTCSLVKPRLNGREVGYFILDTGASGFVLDPQAADSLGLEAFGELQVGQNGRLPATRRRAWVIGRLGRATKPAAAVGSNCRGFVGRWRRAMGEGRPRLPRV